MNRRNEVGGRRPAGAVVTASPRDVPQHGPLDPVAIPRFSPEERRGSVLRLHADEPVVAAKPPATRIPLDAAADVACEKRLGVVDAEAGPLEHTQSTDAASDIRH